VATDAAQQRFRAEVRGWLQEHLTDELRSLSRDEMDDPKAWELRARWEAELASAGYVGLSWPVEYGGRGASLREQLAFDEEYAIAAAPDRAGFFGEQLLGPLLLAHGSAEQRARFLPRILAGTEFWCQGYSEPGAGSDLAGVRTRATLRDGQWHIEGQKIWTSLAQFADWIFVLCRTDPESTRHHGLSLLLCPLGQPGVDIRPIRQLTGGREFNEVFFDGARTEADLVVGDVGRGWQVAMAVLGFERGTAFLGRQRVFARQYEDLLQRFRGRPLAQRDGGLRDELVQAWIELQVMRAMGLRTVQAYANGGVPGPEGSVGKLFWSQWHQRVGELALRVDGLAGALLAGGRLSEQQYELLFSRQDTIAAGSSEIQRNILAERVLGLARQP